MLVMAEGVRCDKGGKYTGCISLIDLNKLKLGVVARSWNEVDLCAESKWDSEGWNPLISWLLRQKEMSRLDSVEEIWADSLCRDRDRDRDLSRFSLLWEREIWAGSPFSERLRRGFGLGGSPDFGICRSGGCGVWAGYVFSSLWTLPLANPHIPPSSRPSGSHDVPCPCPTTHPS